MNAKKKILSAAQEVFANQTYEHATIKTICDMAGVNIASVNYYFRSKKDLYLEVMQYVHSQIDDKVTRIFEHEIKGESAEEWEGFVQVLVSAFVEFEEKGKYSRIWQKIIFRELNNPSAVFNEIYELYCLPILEHIDSVFKKFLPEMSEEERFQWILTLLAQVCFIHSGKGLILKYKGEDFYKEKNIDALVAHISRTICHPLGK